MAEYVATFRTNYFRVKDHEAFERFMKSAGFSEDSPNCPIWQEKDAQGRTCHAFGGTSSIDATLNLYFHDGNESDRFITFCEALQAHVADDDCIIIVEAGHEKLREVNADATIITKDRIQPIAFAAYVSHCAKAVMGQGYNPKLSY